MSELKIYTPKILGNYTSFTKYGAKKIKLTPSLFFPAKLQKVLTAPQFRDRVIKISKLFR